MPLTTVRVLDEIQLSQVVLMAGNTSIIVVCALGTRDRDGRFVWSEKRQFQMFPADDLPQDMDSSIPSDVRVMPPSLVRELREFLIALEDSLQDIVNEDHLPLPSSMAEVKARGYADPRIETTWKTSDGHNSADPNLPIPTAKARIVAVRERLTKAETCGDQGIDVLCGGSGGAGTAGHSGGPGR